MREYDVLWSGIVRHALRNAVLPCMTLIATNLSGLICGSFAIECHRLLPMNQELSDTTLLAAWKDVFSDTLPACEDKMLKPVDVGTGLGSFPIVLGQMGYPCIGAGLDVSRFTK